MTLLDSRLRGSDELIINRGSLNDHKGYDAPLFFLVNADSKFFEEFPV